MGFLCPNTIIQMVLGFRGYIGTMEKKMETTIYGLGFWDLGVSGLGGLGFRVFRFWRV